MFSLYVMLSYLYLSSDTLHKAQTESHITPYPYFNIRTRTIIARTIIDPPTLCGNIHIFVLTHPLPFLWKTNNYSW